LRFLMILLFLKNKKFMVKLSELFSVQLNLKPFPLSTFSYVN
jgi:hypothetical protein